MSERTKNIFEGDVHDMLADLKSTKKVSANENKTNLAKTKEEAREILRIKGNIPYGKKGV